MRKMDNKDYQGWVAIGLTATLFLVALLLGMVSIVDSITGNNLRPEDLQMIVTITVALLGTIGGYLGVSAYQSAKKKDDDDAGE